MTSSGATTQLAALGVQDAWTVMKPQRSLWVGGTVQCTNFAMAEQLTCPSGTVGFGRKLCYKLERNGDLVHRVYFRPQLPQILYDSTFVAVSDGNGASYIDSCGYLMISEAVVQIGGHEFDSHTGEYLAIYDQLSLPEGRRPELNVFQPQNGSVRTLMSMSHYGNNAAHINGVYGSTVSILYVPLRFWFCEFPQQALSLLNLQYHEVKIDITLRPLSEISFEAGTAVNHSTLSGARIPVVFNAAGTVQAATTSQPQTTLEEADLLVQYVYLDTAERRAFVNQKLEYLYTEVQFQGSETHTNIASQAFRLNFNHPVKELLWVCQDDAAITGEAGTAGLNGHAAEFIYPNSRMRFVSTWVPGQIAFLAETANNVSCPAILTSHHTLNGHQRTINNFDANYFRTVQPLQHHSRKPTVDGIHVYSYAHAPESADPTGSLNTSRIDNLIHTHTFPTSTTHGFTGQVRHYARSMNVVKIVGGMAGKMFAS